MTDFQSTGRDWDRIILSLIQWYADYTTTALKSNII